VWAGCSRLTGPASTADLAQVTADLDRVRHDYVVLHEQSSQIVFDARVAERTAARRAGARAARKRLNERHREELAALEEQWQGRGLRARVGRRLRGGERPAE